MKNYKIGMHVQEFFEINIVTRGCGVHYIEDNSKEAKVGDVFIVPPMVWHGYEGGEGFDVFHVLVSDKFIEKNLNELQMLPSFFRLFTDEPLLKSKTKSAEVMCINLTEEQFSFVDSMLKRALDYRDYTNIFAEIYRSGFGISFIAVLCKFYTENNNVDVEKTQIPYLQMQFPIFTKITIQRLL